MEGGRRVLPVALALAAAVATAACGDSRGTVHTDRPAVTFAPLVELDSRERWLPMGARWFVDRAALWFAEDDGCEHRKIAVGRRLEAQRTEIVDWLYVTGIGIGTPSYTRIAYDGRCDLDSHAEFSTVQTNRPWQRHRRPAELRLGEGFYMDLMDWARPGPGREALDRVPTYVERQEREAGGEPGLRLTYWFLFGMDDPRPPEAANGAAAHEGDWERVEVLLRGRDGAYEPVSLRVRRPDGAVREVPWRSTRRAAASAAEEATHPVLAAERGSHALDPRPPQCSACLRWRTWRRVERARGQHWYGFGGAWGDYGPTAATTGSLGPRGGEPDPPVDPPDDLAGAGSPVPTARPAKDLAPVLRSNPGERAQPVAYLERRVTSIARRPALRLVYSPAGSTSRGRPGRGGGSQRLDVLVAKGRRDGHWIPVAVVFHGGGGDRTRVWWDELERTAAGGRPVVYADRDGDVQHRRPGRS